MLIKIQNAEKISERKLKNGTEKVKTTTDLEMVKIASIKLPFPKRTPDSGSRKWDDEATVSRTRECQWSDAIEYGTSVEVVQLLSAMHCCYHRRRPRPSDCVERLCWKR